MQMSELPWALQESMWPWRLPGLLSDDLSKMPYLIMVSRKAIKTIKHNQIFSQGVLSVAVAPTAPGILRPITGALLHELSSIPVIVNSMKADCLRTEDLVSTFLTIMIDTIGKHVYDIL
jgi:hypothetical protein